jgi:signal transduction histidine kinase
MANVDHIKQIIAMQQGIACSGGVLGPVVLSELFGHALSINLASLDRHEIEVVREFADLPAIVADRHQVLQVLVNLISNAKFAMLAVDSPVKRLTLRLEADPVHPEFLLLQVSDTGMGIKPEHLPQLFTQGFTTKLNGHGFGLHSSALAAKAMGGLLEVHSDGEGRGATFTLRLPAPIQKLLAAA